MSHSTSPTPRPPYSSGHDTTDQRASSMTRSQARWASNPSAVSSDGKGPVPFDAEGALASSHERESDTPPDIGQQSKGPGRSDFVHKARRRRPVMPHAVIVDAVRTPVGRR